MRCKKQNLQCDYGAGRQAQPRSHADKALQLIADNEVTSHNSNATTCLLEPPSESIEDNFGLPFDVEDFIDTAMVSSSNDKINLQYHIPSHMRMETLTYDNLPALIDHRMGYVIEQIKLVPRMFAEQCRTPWCHPLQYHTDMPVVMREVQAACALFAVKNETNSKSIWRNIEGRAAALFALERPTDPVELLAYTQAMLLYQIMRFFGGDVCASV